MDSISNIVRERRLGTRSKGFCVPMGEFSLGLSFSNWGVMTMLLESHSPWTLPIFKKSYRKPLLVSGFTITNQKSKMQGA